MTCQSFSSSVSLDPPLVLFCPAKTSRAWPLMQRAGYFCVNLLADGQHELSNAMATKGTEKFDGVGWKPVEDRRAAARRRRSATSTARSTPVHEAGDHYVVIGRVQDLGPATAPGPELSPLLFHRGAYTQPE